MNPCQVVLDAFKFYLENIEMEQLAQVLTVYPHLAASVELNNFMELLTPMAGALVGQLGITSTGMTQVVEVVLLFHSYYSYLFFLYFLGNFYLIFISGDCR